MNRDPGKGGDQRIRTVFNILKQLTIMNVQSRPVKEIINELIETIDRTGSDAGGSHDNLTAVLIEMLTDSI